MPIPTKIEFSQRTNKLDKEVVYAAIDKDVISQHREYPIMCNHYDQNAAFLQKVSALLNTEFEIRPVLIVFRIGGAELKKGDGEI